MKHFLRIAFLSLVSLTLVHCSSDDSTQSASASLIVNGTEFKLGSNSPSISYNIIKTKNQVALWLDITEKDGSGRVISVYAMHETASPTGVYSLSNSVGAGGIAIPALYDAQGHQISGGSDESQPTGTISILDQGSNHYSVTFTDVILDPGTATETTISGTCNKTFKLAPGN